MSEATLSTRPPPSLSPDSHPKKVSMAGGISQLPGCTSEMWARYYLTGPRLLRSPCFLFQFS